MTRTNRPPLPRDILLRATAHNNGTRAWREWKEAQAVEIVELAEKASRMELLELDLEGDFRVVYGVLMPVPRKPINGRLVVGDRAVFHGVYQEQWRVEGPAGWQPLGLLHPSLDVFHPNMSASIQGAICLGLTLPPGVPVREIILLGFAALALQTCTVDETDPHGVVNGAACEYFRQHDEYLPLTTAGFYDPPETNPKEPK